MLVLAHLPKVAGRIFYERFGFVVATEMQESNGGSQNYRSAFFLMASSHHDAVVERNIV